MFPQIRSKSQQLLPYPSVQLSPKLKQWNDRFILESMPEYSPDKDRHIKKYRKVSKQHNSSQPQSSYTPLKHNIILNKSSIPSQRSLSSLPSQKIVQSNPKQSKNNQPQVVEERINLLIRYLEEKYPECNNNQFVQFHKILLSHAVPSLFIYFLLKSYVVKNMRKVEGFDAKQEMQKQIKDIKNKDGFYYKINGSWQARQRFLEILSKFIKEKVQNDQQVHQSKEKLKQHIKQLRLLTTNLIDIVKRWRQSLNIEAEQPNLSEEWMSAPQRPIYYIDGEKHKQNMLLHILNDTNFILSSAIANCVRMGTKNDPFLLSPLTKADNKEISEILQIFQLNKEEAGKYKKMMEYLANQKAYDLKNRPRKQVKKSLNKIEKIYLQNHRSKIQNADKILNGSLNGTDQKSQQEKKKLKIQRLNKNKQRIQMIKAVYDRSGSRIRVNSQQDELIDEIGQITLPKQQAGKNRTQLDQQFDRLVQERYDLIKIPLEKQYSPARKKKIQNQAPITIKLETEQDKMIKKLKNLNDELRQKLQDINKQTNSKQPISPSKYAGKNNKQIVDELKKEIITKIEAQQQEKLMYKKKRKEQEERILNQIKEKMKKDIEEKIALKKQQKMQEKQKLEKQLIEEQNRIKQQRQIQIQMLVRISKEKEMRNIEKLKREAIQKQNMLKEQLLREQSLRKEKEQLIEKEKAEKLQLIRELQAKQLKNQLKQQIKQVYTIKNATAQTNEQTKSENQLVRQIAVQNLKIEDPLNVSQASVIGQTKQKSPEQLKLQKQLELRKEIQVLKQKKERQISIIEKQNQLRAKMLKFKKNEQQIIDKDIDLLRRRNIQLSQQNPAFSNADKQAHISNEEELKKLEALQRMQKQKEAEQLRQAEFNKVRKQRQTQESILRQKIKQKIEKQLRQEAVKRTRKQMQQRQQKEYQRKKELGEYRHKVFTQNPINREAIVGQEKQKILESQFLYRQVRQQNAKASLRSQFEQELLASSVSPKFYIDKQYLKVKNTAEYLGDDYLHEKMQASKDAVVRYQQLEHSPLKKSSIREHIYDLTDQQLYIYKKQKSKNMENMDEPKRQIYIDKQLQNQYEKVNVNHQESQTLKNNTEVKKKTKNEQKDSQDERKRTKLKNNMRDSQKKQKKTIIKQMGEIKNQQTIKNSTDSENDVAKNSRKQKQKPTKLKINKNKQAKPGNDSKHQKDIKKQISDEESNQQPERQNYLKFNSVNSIGYKKLPQTQMAQKFKFGLEFEAIPQSELDHHLEIHFARLPFEQTDILPMKREELYRKLVNELTFSIIVGSFQNKVIGTAYIHHDRFTSSTLASPETRKFKISHIATYENKQLKPFILQICQFILLKDPCDQVEFVYHFNQNQQDQFRFSKDLTKWFNEHGSIYQKKLDQNIYERKFLYKRQYYHKCEIDLKRVNKSIFKNIISVNSGIYVIRNQLHEIKQHFEIEPDCMPLQNKTLYTLLLSELFRTYMSPEEADLLKKQLKNTTYKQLLTIIIAIQKKKLKIDEYRLSEYKSLMQLNMKMMSQGKQIVNFLQEKGNNIKQKGKKPGDDQSRNEIFYGEINWRGGVMFNFQVAALPITQSEHDDNFKSRSSSEALIRNINYFRLNPLPKYKLHLIKSSLYNTEMYMLPTQSQKLKIFILPAEQYLEIKQKQVREPPPTPMTLHTYLRIYMRNVSKYIEDTQYQYIWIPEVSADRQIAKIDEYKGFYQRDIYIHDSMNMSYKQFIPSGLIIQPQHRDLVITAPFVIGLMSMGVEQVIEGCPLYGRLIQTSELKIMQMH